MSDYFSNNYRYGHNYHTNFGRHIGQIRDDLNSCYRECEKRDYYNWQNQHQKHHDLLRLGMLPRAGEDFPERMDVDYMIKLERLSSNLVQLLSTARQSSQQSYNLPGIVYIPPKDNLRTDIDPHKFRNNIPCNQTHMTHGVHQVEVELKRRERHNKVERRRRSIINERIAELRDMLPEDISRATLGRKCKVLKEAIDYIKKLQENIKQVHQLEDQLDTICKDVNKMSHRLDKLEMQTEAVSVKDKQEDVKTSKSLKNTVDNQDIKPYYEFSNGTFMSILDLGLPQDTLFTDTTSSFEITDVLEDASTPLSIDTSTSLQSSLELDFDVLDYVVTNDGSGRKL